jgi:hydrogenase maturation protease
VIDELRPYVENKKTLILGIGNRQRGDEGAGCFLVKRLKGKVSVPLIDGGTIPEKHLSIIEASRPDVVLVFAAGLIPNANAGEVAWFRLNELRTAGVSLFAADLSLLFKVLPKDVRPETLVVVVQPEMEEHQGVSDAVRDALDGLESLCVELFG